MLRALINAIWSAFTVVFRFGRWVLERSAAVADAALSVPGAVLRSLLGGSGPAPLPQPSIAPAPLPSRIARRLRAHGREASICWRYARAAVSGRDRPSLDALDRVTRDWLEGLDSQELERLAMAGISRVGRHLRGSRPLHGLPRVGDVVPAKRVKGRRRDREPGLAFAQNLIAA